LEETYLPLSPQGGVRLWLGGGLAEAHPGRLAHPASPLQRAETLHQNPAKAGPSYAASVPHAGLSRAGGLMPASWVCLPWEMASP